MLLWIIVHPLGRK